MVYLPRFSAYSANVEVSIKLSKFMGKRKHLLLDATPHYWEKCLY